MAPARETLLENSTRRTLLLGGVVCLLLFCSSCTAAPSIANQHAGSGRRLLIRPLPSGAGSCKNTYQGPMLMADDQGKVCDTKDLDFYTGCCKEGQQHACDKCGKEDSCCGSFEHCVSCCMSPDNKPEERRQSYPRVPNNKGAGVWDTVFEYCMAVCRTHVFSTSHENAYIGTRHHCFSKLGKPLLSPPLPPAALDGVKVVLSAAGSSCASTCEQQGGGSSMVCSPQHLHFLNSCDRLREVNNCEAGCVQEEHAGFMPAAVDPEAPKASRPALCLVSSKDSSTQASGTDAFSCDASENHMRRLCPCVQRGSSKASSSSKEGDASAAATAAGEAADSSTAKTKKQQKPELEGPDQLGATKFEGTGVDAAETGAADGAGDNREYEEDPNREQGAGE